MKSTEHRKQTKAADVPEIVYEPIKNRAPELTAAAVAHLIQVILSRPSDIDLPVIV